MTYELEGSTLKITGELSQVLDLNFDIHTQELLELPDSRLTIDLSGVNYMASQYLGALAAVAMEAGKANKELVVIATAKVSAVIELAGFDRILKLETI